MIRSHVPVSVAQQPRAIRDRNEERRPLMSHGRPSFGQALAALLLLALCAAAAQSGDNGLTLAFSGPAQAAPAANEALAAALAPRLVDAVEPLVTMPVKAAGLASLDQNRLFDDLRRLPRQLRELALQDPAQFPTRYVACLRVVDVKGALTGEVALVDLQQAALLGFKSAALSEATMADQLQSALVDLVLAALPGARRPQPAETRTEVTPHATARGALSFAEGDLVGREDAAPERNEDQPQTTAPTATPPPTATATATPQTPPTPAEPAALAPTTRPEPAAVAVEGTALSELLSKYTEGALATAGLGTAEDDPWLLENEDEVHLLRVGDQVESDGGALNAGLSVYSISDRTRVEIQFSEPVSCSEPSRSGNWLAVDVDGLQPEREHVIEVGRSGLLSIHLKPLAESDAMRVGFRLTGAGQLNIELSDDHTCLIASAEKDLQEALLSSVVNPQLPFTAPIQVVRSFYGVSSWYGGRCHGGPTASGERFNQWGWTAAHKTLPLGTWIRVTNPHNGRAAILRINDRGPYIRGRSLDVSAGAAQALGFYGSGVCRLKIEVLDVD